jgi:hypothetical protein
MKVSAVLAALAAGTEGFSLVPPAPSGGALCTMRQPAALGLRAPPRTGPALTAKVRATTAAPVRRFYGVESRLLHAWCHACGARSRRA